jgi:hypothetical protein
VTRPGNVNRTRFPRLIGACLLIVAIAVLGSIFVPPLVLRDALAPAELAPYVDDARSSVGQNIEGLLPVHLRFTHARCRADGGSVLIFEQWQPPYLGVRYAYAMAGDSPPNSWGGGTGFEDLTSDSEIAYFMGSNEVDCE